MDELLYLIKCLIDEGSHMRNVSIPQDEEERFALYRSLVNIRPPKPASAEYLSAEDKVLTALAKQKGIVDIAALKPAGNNIYLWQGDITRLKCGAIVNAANSGMTGCYQPCHNCIDNCIHTFAGVRLRLKCAEIMQKQGFEEPTGGAKITPAYNLPCDYVIHTVGPIVGGRLNNEHCRLLKSCYTSCMQTAVKNNVGSLAFCCISTGVFGFPQDKAAEIAVDTVKAFVAENDLKVIFNVFKNDDLRLYQDLLGV